MVNTRRKSHVPTTEDSASQIAEQSDSSTTSITTRRSTRRSVGSISVQTPVIEVATPIRRSRRLSNSSVESTTNNDTPRPATRRSTRNKNTGSDHESSDVELLVIKRRKVVEGVESLGAISEEKNEAERLNQPQEIEKPIVIELENGKEELKEIREKSETPEIFEDCQEAIDSVDENHGVKVESSSELPVNSIEIEDAKIPEKLECVNLEESTRNVTTNEIKVEVETTEVMDHEEKKSEVIAQEEKQSSETENCVEVNETTKEISPVKSEVEKPRMLFGVPANTISVNPKNLIQTIQETQIGNYTYLYSSIVVFFTEHEHFLGGKKKASVGKKAPLRRKFLVEKKVEPPKVALPCGADIMRNIPRGKCKSGREWKEPKSK